jgi:hypothetical protein
MTVIREIVVEDRPWAEIEAEYGGRITIEQQRWIAVLAATPDPSITDSAAACLGGISALQVHGLRNISADRVHVVVPPQRQIQPPAGVAVRRVRLGEGDRHPLAKPPATTPGRSLVDAAAWARSDDEARLIIAASLQQRLVTATEVDAVLERTPMTFRRQLVIATVRDAAGGSHRLGELAFVRICRYAATSAGGREATDGGAGDEGGGAPPAAFTCAA